MSKPLQIYDLVCNDGAARMVHGVIIEDEHACWYHTIPCKAIVYMLSQTSDHSQVNTVWCELEMIVNGYHKMTKRTEKKVKVKYKPYTDVIPGEPFFTHVYSLRLDDEKYFVGLTANLHDDLENHKVGVGHWWTTEHPMIEVVETLPLEPALPEHEAVTIATLLRTELYDKYGHENVKSNIRFVKTDLYRHRYYR